MFGKEAGYWQDIFGVSERTRMSESLRFGGDREGVPADLRNLWSEFRWNQPMKNIRVFDAYIRGRDLGGVKERAERVAALITIGTLATAIDLIDYAAEFLELAGPVGLLVSTVLEVGTDQLIALGSNELVQAMTEDEEVEFASPLSHTAATIAAGAPHIRHTINAVNIEAVQQAYFNVPFYGAIFEKKYIALNKAIQWLENDERPGWVRGGVKVFTGGLARGFGKATARPVAAGA